MDGKFEIRFYYDKFEAARSTSVNDAKTALTNLISSNNFALQSCGRTLVDTCRKAINQMNFHANSYTHLEVGADDTRVTKQIRAAFLTAASDCPLDVKHSDYSKSFDSLGEITKEGQRRRRRNLV